MTQVISAGEADLEELSHVLAEAFFDLPPFRWLIPDPVARRQVFPVYFRILLDNACACGAICTTPERDSAAAWIPVGEHSPGPLPDYQARLRAATLLWTGRFQAFDAALARRHPTGIPHQHLALLAVRPGRQGQGTGTALLDAYHQMLDQARIPGYAEALSQRNRDLYLRIGYADLSPPIRLPGGPSLYPLWREPPPPEAQSPATIPGPR